MVRLKAHQRFYVLHKQILFQFHYGTIKRRLNAPFMPIGQKFQFHYGTIKSEVVAVYIAYIVLFQFHYGTIKSPSDL